MKRSVCNHCVMCLHHSTIWVNAEATTIHISIYWIKWYCRAHKWTDQKIMYMQGYRILSDEIIHIISFEFIFLYWGICVHCMYVLNKNFKIKCTVIMQPAVHLLLTHCKTIISSKSPELFCWIYSRILVPALIVFLWLAAFLKKSLTFPVSINFLTFPGFLVWLVVTLITWEYN